MNKSFFLIFVFIFSIGIISCSKMENNTKSVPQQKWDLDFTKMNFNFASGIMFDFLLNPEEYEGKTVLIKGQYHTEVYQNKRLYAVFIWDATGCCPQSLTFVPPQSFVFPDGFPREKQEITLYGKLKKVSFEDSEELNLIAEDMIF